MTVSPTSPSTEIDANSAGYTARSPKQVLGSDDFMKLLSTQMANQDPMKPMEDTAFVSQMASFSSLAQMNQLTKDFAQLRASQTVSTATSYIGREVTVNPTGNAADEVTGMVGSVDTSGDEPLLMINGTPYSLSAVLSIRGAQTITEPPVATTSVTTL